MMALTVGPALQGMEPWPDSLTSRETGQTCTHAERFLKVQELPRSLSFSGKKAEIGVLKVTNAVILSTVSRQERRGNKQGDIEYPYLLPK